VLEIVITEVDELMPIAPVNPEPISRQVSIAKIPYRVLIVTLDEFGALIVMPCIRIGADIVAITVTGFGETIP
jgi:hypothetical protein